MSGTFVTIAAGFANLPSPTQADSVALEVFLTPRRPDVVGRLNIAGHLYGFDQYDKDISFSVMYAGPAGRYNVPVSAWTGWALVAVLFMVIVLTAIGLYQLVRRKKRERPAAD